MTDDKLATALRECEEAMVEFARSVTGDELDFAWSKEAREKLENAVRRYGDLCREAERLTLGKALVYCKEHRTIERPPSLADVAAARLAGRLEQAEIMVALDHNECHHLRMERDRLRREAGK